MSENLSKYFCTNPPSIFDQIQTKNDLGSAEMFIDTELRNTPSQDIAIEDEIRDQWLRANKSATMGTTLLLTSPGIYSTTDLSDPVFEATSNLLGSEVGQERTTLKPDDVTQDERGLRKLIEEGCFRAAVNLTTRLLTIYGQGPGRLGQPAKHTPHSLQLWFTRFSLLIKLGLFDLAIAESEAFGQLDRPDVFYEYYPEMYSGRQGSMASFSFRILMAEMPMHATGREKFAMDRLTHVNSICEQIIQFYCKKENQKAVRFWEERQARALQGLMNCALSLKNYGLVKSLMQRISSMKIWSPDQLRYLNSTWYRIYLLCGDIPSADQILKETQQLQILNSSEGTTGLLDAGLRAIAENDFAAGLEIFQKASQVDPTNITIVNNTAVCQLYTGQLNAAIKTYEAAIEAMPGDSLNEFVILNLATLYELQSSNARAKKLQLLAKINKNKQQDLSLNLDYCLKLHT